MSRKTPITALGSVVATIAPSSRQTVSGWPAIGCSAKPIAAVVATTANTASTSTGAVSRASRRTSIDRPPWNTSAGRNANRNAWELTGKWAKVAANRCRLPPTPRLST